MLLKSMYRLKSRTNLGITDHEPFFQLGIKVDRNGPKGAYMTKRKLDRTNNNLSRRHDVHYQLRNF